MSLNSTGTDVFYNGIWLRNCLTTQFDQTVEYDESQTDRLYTKFHITVESLVSETTVTECLGIDLRNRGLATATAQRQMSAVHGLLSVPRMQFEYYQGGVPLIIANSLAVVSGSTSNSQTPFFATTTDLNNGPKPKEVRIQQVLANRCYRVSFSIEVCLLICGDLTDLGTIRDSLTGAPTSPKSLASENRRLLSNRFSIEETRDGNFLNTRILTGRARVAHKSLWSLTVRYLLLPLLPNGYKRESVSFTHHSNGLDVAYRVVDRQRIAAPPWPAIDFAGSHTEATGIDGVTSVGSVSVRVVGPPGRAKKHLLLAAVAVIEAKIGSFTKLGEVDHRVLVEHIQITDVLQDNVIELAVQFKRHGKEDDVDERYVNLVFERLGLLPNIFTLRDGTEAMRQDNRPPNSDVWPESQDPWGDEGVAPYGVFAAFLQDGCWPEHYSPDLSSYIGPTYPDRYSRSEPSGTASSYRTDDESLGKEPPPPDKKKEIKASEEQKQFPYTDVEVKTDYFNNYGWVALPYMKDNQVPEDGDVVLTKLHATTCRKNVFISAKRIGAQPKFPKIDYEYTDPNGIRHVLDEFHTELNAPKVIPNGQELEYEISARLVYLMSRGLKPDDDLTFGSLPWDITKKADNKVSINVEQQDEEMV